MTRLEVEQIVTSMLNRIVNPPPAVPGLRTLGSGARQAAAGDSVISDTTTLGTTAPLTGGGNVADNLTIAIPVATGAAAGYLASADWTTFNGKVSSSRSISTTAPLTGGGDLSANRTFVIAKSTAAVDGYLAAADFVVFNSKDAGGSAAAAQAAAIAYASALVPIGSVICWTTATPPTGWISANGSSLARVGTYAGLFAVIGTVFGSVDADHFTLPNPTILVADTLWIIRYA